MPAVPPARLSVNQEFTLPQQLTRDFVPQPGSLQLRSYHNICSKRSFFV